MKVFYNDLLDEFDRLDNSFSILVTIAEGATNWNAIPNAELEIIKERLKTISSLTDSLYEILEKSPK